MKLGRLTLIDSKKDDKKRALWRCDCGTLKRIRFYSVKSQRIKSCGCLKRERLTKHGKCRTPEYFTWKNMRQRCFDKNQICYKNYGGRGISVCKRWDDFEAFAKDMGRKPTPKHTIERINNELGYSPENCKWATMKEQQNNKRKPNLVVPK